MTIALALQWVAAATVGLLAWGLVEYGIHGVLSHRLRTFVSPIHWSHHRTPAAVFTSPLAWVPVALLAYAIAVMLVGRLLGVAFMVGLLLGFAHYEFVHWRIHFKQPRNARQRRQRSHHLAHHFVNPRAYHGVTTRFWDRAFRSLPREFRDDYARVADVAPLEGASNLAAIWSPRAGLRVARSALDSTRRSRNLRG